MKQAVLSLFCALFIFAILSQLPAQTIDTTDQVITASGNMDAPQMPPNNIPFSKMKWLLTFGLIVIVIEGILVKYTSARWTPYSIIRLFGLTLIIIASLVLASGTDSETPISAVIGLLGTLAGYLLGKDLRSSDLTESHGNVVPTDPTSDLPEPPQPNG